MKNKNLIVHYLARIYQWVISMPLIHLSNFLFSRKIACNYFKKLTDLHLFETKTFLTCHNRFFTKSFLPDFGRWDANVMTLPDQLAPKQIANPQNTTTWQQNSAKTFIKRPISTTSGLGSQKTRKYQKNLKLGGDRCQCPVFLLEMILW